MKLFGLFTLTCAFTALAFATEVYYIKASGEFGKELANMAKEYAKDKNQIVDVYVDDDPRVYKDTRVFKLGVNRNANYSQSLGKELYEKECASCHGIDANKRPSGAKELSKLSAKEIEDSVIAYRNDTEFGGSMRHVMRNVATRISNSNLGAIVFYLKGKDAYAGEADNEGNQPVSTEKKQGSYLR